MQAALYMLLTWQSLVLFPLLIIDESWGRVATYVMLAGKSLAASLAGCQSQK